MDRHTTSLHTYVHRHPAPRATDVGVIVNSFETDGLAQGHDGRPEAQIAERVRLRSCARPHGIRRRGGGAARWRVEDAAARACVLPGRGLDWDPPGRKPGCNPDPGCDSGLWFRVAGRWTQKTRNVRSERTRDKRPKGLFVTSLGLFPEKWVKRSLGEKGHNQGAKAKGQR